MIASVAPEEQAPARSSSSPRKHKSMDELLTRWNALEEAVFEAIREAEFFEACGDEEQENQARELWASLLEEQDIVGKAILRADLAALQP